MQVLWKSKVSRNQLNEFERLRVRRCGPVAHVKLLGHTDARVLLARAALSPAAIALATSTLAAHASPLQPLAPRASPRVRTCASCLHPCVPACLCRLCLVCPFKRFKPDSAMAFLLSACGFIAVDKQV